mmetsp:Transcript_65189/g.201807  ORF Transcript_65189/g.201807 Transcript_65189/m.201807 type:complete len:196 (+) Transcript_65189:45-632(+)
MARDARQGQLPGSAAARLAALDRRLAACESQLGIVASEVPGAPLPSVPEQVADIQRRVDDAFGTDEALQRFEQGMAALDAWLQQEHATTSRVLLHAGAKRSFVVQHAAQLLELARALRELEYLEPFARAPAPSGLAGQGERLRQAEASGAAAAGGAARLHQHVTQVAEDFHRTIASLNTQLLHWDKVLSKRQHSH